MPDSEIKNYSAYVALVTDACKNYQFVERGPKSRLIRISGFELGEFNSQDEQELVKAVDTALDVFTARIPARQRIIEVLEMVYPLNISREATNPQAKNPLNFAAEVLPKLDTRGQPTGEYGVTRGRIAQLTYPPLGFVAKALYHDPYLKSRVTLAK